MKTENYQKPTLKNLSLKELSSKEWLYTNGLGGYASSTLPGMNSRRYHGLLVASFNPPTERQVLVSKVEETILTSEQEIHLSTNQYPDVYYPEGYVYLADFERDPLPKFTFEAAGFKLAKSVWMVYQSNTTIVEYTNLSDKPLKLKLTPFFSKTDYHHHFRQDTYHDFYMDQLDVEKRRVIYPHYGAEPLYFGYCGGTFKEERSWNCNLIYQGEQDRGQDFQGDLYAIGSNIVELKPGEMTHLVFSLDKKMMYESPLILKVQELKRLNALTPTSVKNDFLKDLILSADQFLVKRESTGSYSLIAGYHWFTDWGRDTMIAMQGLCIALNRKKEAQSILKTFLKYLKDGLLPNRFPDSGEAPEYNTADATLWLFVAAYEYDLQFLDDEFLSFILLLMKDILDEHISGTKYQIHVTPEGFLYAGEAGVQLTWMDAKLGNYVVTPRIGCTVELNALWYNALKIYGYACRRLGRENEQEYQHLIELLEKNFVKYFWNEKGYLNDVINADGSADEKIRPNQVYALSLPFDLLKNGKQARVLDTLKNHLLTPYGLRSLSPEDPDFIPEYKGNAYSRDMAYHQGTVWAFLLPEYFWAYLKINKFSKKAKAEVEEMLQPMISHFYEDNCLYGIAEIFDGLHPQEGKGCVQQAWSVGNLLKLILRASLFSQVKKISEKSPALLSL